MENTDKFLKTRLPEKRVRKIDKKTAIVKMTKKQIEEIWKEIENLDSSLEINKDGRDKRNEQERNVWSGRQNH